MQELNKRQRFSLLIWGFITAAFGGWLYEELCVYILYHKIYNRGMLHLTICPIYGFGAWGLYLLLRKVRSSGLYFALSVLTASVFEYGCSYLLEFLFHRTYWTYEGWFLSIQNRISLVSSLIFGLLAVVFAKLILPLLTKAVGTGKSTVWFIVSLLALAVIVGDFVLVVSGY
ncbi:MAG: putative ABC transporter permease [Oscillospiraceae bacterium]|nr:putative ABC transporter permease [Oscillospiraceae bacterium]